MNVSDRPEVDIERPATEGGAFLRFMAPSQELFTVALNDANTAVVPLPVERQAARYSEIFAMRAHERQPSEHQ